jgi:hypothetical protein
MYSPLSFSGPPFYLGAPGVGFWLFLSLGGRESDCTSITRPAPLLFEAYALWVASVWG